MEDVEAAIGKLKNGKVLGAFGISAEILKSSGGFGGGEVASQDSQYSMVHERGFVMLEESSDNSSKQEGKQDRML